MKASLVIALCALAVGVAGCGGGAGGSTSTPTTASPSTTGSGGPALSKAAYQAELTRIGAEAKSAQALISQTAEHAKTIAQLQDALRRYAVSGDRFAAELDKLNPPKAAASANAALAQGEHDNATDIRAAIPKLAKFKTAHAGLRYLGSIGATKGSQEVQTAIADLKALGYTLG